ncbi:unnamed protein product [Fusarium equiseti]|uniref:Uncharacterized protein n=1 Tax=Fusarium equiseti TaxID=61235 RepID=A0A8J2IWU1_FUSEQ|nr:unnamed protein product [Fusarium equiseti]
MTGTETSNAGGGFDLLRRATQAMMSSVQRFVALLALGPSPSTGGSGGGDSTMTAFQHPSSAPQLLQASATPPQSSQVKSSSG